MKNKILDFIKNNQPVSTKQIIDYLQISRQMTHRHLKNLLEKDKITKKGSPPKVFYFFKKPEKDVKVTINEELTNFINQNYIYFSPEGEIIDGFNGFKIWCDKTNQKNIIKIAEDYHKTLTKFQNLKNNFGVINGTQKLKNSLGEIYLKKVFYGDFYSIERFGKTYLGNLVFYGKQAQDKELIIQSSQNVRDVLQKIIETEKIEAVCFAPHSIKRELQFLSVAQEYFDFELPLIKAIKITGRLPVPQKSLSKLSERVHNAEKTIFFQNEKRKFQNVLIIDDAVGSGATLNEMAKKLLDQGISKNIFGFAFIGSFKGFDVLKEI